MFTLANINRTYACNKFRFFTTAGFQKRNTSLEFSETFFHLLEVEKKIDSSRQTKDSNIKVQWIFTNTLKKMIADGFHLDRPFPKERKMPLHTAITEKCSLVSLSLIELGASIDKYNRFEETPLYKAACYNQIDVAKLLIDKGASVMKRNHVTLKEVFLPVHFVLPLHAATSPEMINLLLKNG